jgi:origin recognition complex subunit 5
MSSSLFQLPDELILTALNHTFPCREAQTRALATLLYVSLKLSDQILLLK